MHVYVLHVDLIHRRESRARSSRLSRRHPFDDQRLRPFWSGFGYVRHRARACSESSSPRVLQLDACVHPHSHRRYGYRSTASRTKVINYSFETSMHQTVDLEADPEFNQLQLARMHMVPYTIKLSFVASTHPTAICTRSRLVTMSPRRRSQRLIRRAHTSGVNLLTSRTPSGNGLVKTEPSTPESPTLQTQGYRRRLRRQHSARFLHAVLHYDQVKRDLQPWYWCAVYSRFHLVSLAFNLTVHVHRPVTETGERVPPSDLLDHRRTHDFRGPCCLCASLDSSILPAAYTEASIFVAIVGPCIGKYVAACATGQCRYWGKLHVNIVE